MDHKSGEPVSFSLKYKGNSEIPTLGLKHGMKLREIKETLWWKSKIDEVICADVTKYGRFKFVIFSKENS